MKIQVKDKKALLQAAMNLIENDLVIKNAQVVNLFTGEILPGNIFIHQGFISHIEYEDLTDLHARTVYDAQGQYAIPGLIDAHVHIESSMMTPRNFCKAVLPWGTTTVITDPHEIGNVWGVEGVRYMHDDCNELPMRQLVDIPSCVPAVPGLETAGADFLAQQIDELASLERVVGLAEVMDFLAVINGEDRMLSILKVAEEHNLYIQGHAPFLKGRALSAYLCGGPRTCHETRDSAEALSKYRNGMNIDMRDSSMCKNVPAIWEGIKHSRYFDTLCLCTDDRESEDILKVGHINDVIREAIRCGMNPIDAIKSATINTAREIKMDNLGALAPGYVADIVLLPELKTMNPSAVFYQGQQVVQDHQLLVTVEERSFALEHRNSINFRALTADDFKIKAPIQNGKIKVNVMTFFDFTLSSTDITVEELTVEDGYLTLNHDPDLKFVAVVNRYGKANIALHVVRHFGTTHGALASTVSHDSHNLTIVYDTAENALLAAQEIKRVAGGMVAVEDGKILHTLALPIGGLLSYKPAETLAVDANQMKEANRRLGLKMLENPLLRIVTLALPVIPNVKMSDLGLVNVNNKTLISLFAD
ncbi:MAG: adenine deaminase [Erysipelotrichaceae bacterium]|nr:adenine deaminase [Erysipelotrichaceae bacterium]